MSRIGRAIIEILLKSDQAKAEAKSLKQEIQGIGSEASGGSKFDAFQAEMKAFGQEISAVSAKSKEAGSALGEMGKAGLGLGSIISTIAWPVAFFVGVHEINELLEEGRKRAVAFRNALTTGQEPGQDRLRAIQQEIEGVTELQKARQALTRQTQEDEAAIRANAEKANGGPLSFKQYAEVGKAIMDLRAENAKALDALDELYAKESLKRAEDRLARTEAAGKEGIDRLYAEQKLADERLDRERAQANSPEEADRIAATKRAIDAEFDARREKIRIEEADRANEAGERYEVEQAKRERREREAAERTARHAAEVWAREMERATRNLYEAMDRAAQANAAITNQSLSKVTADVSRLAQLVDLRLRANGVDMRR